MSEPQASDINTRLSRYLVEQGVARAVEPGAELALDSYSIVLVIVFLEREWGVRLYPEDITAAAFRCVESIAALVARKRAETSSGDRS